MIETTSDTSGLAGFSYLQLHNFYWPRIPSHTSCDCDWPVSFKPKLYTWITLQHWSLQCQTRIQLFSLEDRCSIFLQNVSTYSTTWFPNREYQNLNHSWCDNIQTYTGNPCLVNILHHFLIYTLLIFSLISIDWQHTKIMETVYKTPIAEQHWEAVCSTLIA
jgi:hypothetical protein